MSSTKNVKGNRLVVMASFPSHIGIFKIPDGRDLEDKTVVKWLVKYGLLLIHYVNGKEDQIEYENEPEIDFQNPEEFQIDDAVDFNIEYDEDKE